MDRRYLEVFGWKGIKPVKGRPEKKKLRPVPGYLSGLEKCFLATLKQGKALSTAAVTSAAAELPLCRGCRDSANLLSAGEALIRKGLAARTMKNGKYYWRRHG
jgi:hypothetical protein